MTGNGHCQACAMNRAQLAGWQEPRRILTRSPRSPFAPGTPCKILNHQVTCNTALSQA